MLNDRQKEMERQREREREREEGGRDRANMDREPKVKEQRRNKICK